MGCTVSKTSRGPEANIPPPRDVCPSSTAEPEEVEELGSPSRQPAFPSSSPNSDHHGDRLPLGRSATSNSVTSTELSSPTDTMFDKVYKRVFCDKELRQIVSTSVAVDANFANSVQRAVQKLPTEALEKFFPPVVVSYSTEHREGVDAQNAGPGYVVVACLIRFLFAHEIPCYSDIMTPAGYRWTVSFIRRVDRGKVMIVVLTQRFFWSAHCLIEVHRAKKRGLEIIPVRLQEPSTDGRKQIETDEKRMWPEKDLESFARRVNPANPSKTKSDLLKMRVDAIEALKNVSTIPNRGTFLSDPEALDDLLHRIQQVQHLLNPTEPPSSARLTREVVGAPSSCMRVVGYAFTYYFVDCDQECDDKEVMGCLEQLLKHVKELLRHDDDKSKLASAITATPLASNGQIVQIIEFDVHYMMRQIRRRYDTAERLIGKLASLVGATEDEIDLFRLMAVFEGSLVVVMEAPTSFFLKIKGIFQEKGNEIVLEKDARVTGIAPAFMLTIPFKLWPDELNETCALPSSEVILRKGTHCSLLVPASNEAFDKLMSGSVNYGPHIMNTKGPIVTPFAEAVLESDLKPIAPENHGHVNTEVEALTSLKPKTKSKTSYPPVGDPVKRHTPTKSKTSNTPTVVVSEEKKHTPTKSNSICPPAEDDEEPQI